MKKNRILTLAVSTLLVLGVLAGCGSTVVVQQADSQAPAASNPANPANTPDTSGGAVKTGLYFVGSLSNSKSATADTDGDGRSDITLIAVTVDDGGVIDQCIVDGIRSDIYFNNKGELVTDTSAVVESKNVLGDAYGMRKASSIGAEWNEQMAALAAFAEGKKVSELKGLAVNADGTAADADLAASATLNLGKYVDGIIAAAESAQNLGASKGDELRLASATTLSSSKNATADAAGLARSYPIVSVVTLNGDKITSCIIDAMQANVNFDTTGAITSDINTAPKSKNVLGDDYGMRKASGIGKEWNEQAAFFAEYVTGKTIAQVAGIATDEGGHATDADIASGATVHINDLQAVILKAAGQAVKTGLYFVGSLSNSKSATADADGDGRSDITLIAVTVDDGGVIDQCIVDGIRSDIYFNNKGELVTDTSAVVESKNVLGDAYGMRKASSIRAEWNEQMAALAAFAEGKKVSELKGLAVNADGTAADADLAASATLNLGKYVDGIIAAAESARHLGASKGDKLTLASATTLSSSKNATADAAGLARSYPIVSVVTLKGNTITSCIIDAMQANVNFDTTGAITSDINTAPKSKNVLGDDYGMRKASGIGKEWNEQAAFFAEYVTGKTIAQVADIATDEGGHATDADIASGATVHINDLQAVILKAAE